MRLHTLVIGASLLALSASQLAFAQAKDTIIIEASRLDQTLAESGTDISVIGKADIERRALTLALDAIATAPGVTVSQAGPFGGLAYARIRGNSSSHTLVLVDGVPVNDVSSTGGGYDFATFDLGDVERIEVLKGPQSTLWGSDAIGGVVSILTEQPGKGLGWRAFAEGGSFNTVRAGASVSGGDDRAQGRFSITGTTTDGVSMADEADGNSEDDGLESLTYSARGGFKLSDTARLDFTARLTDAEFDIDGSPAPAFTLTDTADTTKLQDGGASATLSAAAFGIDHTLQAIFSSTDRENFNGAGVSTVHNEGERMMYRYAGEMEPGQGHKLVFGAEREEDEANGQDANANSLFALYEFKPMATLTLTGGLRYDDDDRFGSKTTARIAASWQVADDLRLRASAGQGFKAPTIFQSTYICGFCGLTAPNPNLKAETSESIDAGVDWTIAGVDVSVTAFDQRTENLIDFSFTAGYDNIALARTRGFELDVRAPINAWLEVRAGYANIEAEDGFGAPLPRVPLHSGDLELIFTPMEQLTASLSVRHNGEQTDAFAPGVPAYTRLDAAATWKFSKDVEFYGRIENLLDAHYNELDGYGTPGLSGVIGVRFKG